MRIDVLQHLACPACASELTCRPEDEEGDHIMTGTLVCVGCQNVYPIARGVPRLNVSMEGLERVARTFSFEWESHGAGRLEQEDTLWGLTLEEDWAYFLEATQLENQLQGKIVLDAGCGSGRLTRQIGEHGAKTVIGVDMIDAVDGAFHRSRDVPNVHIVQGNIFELPLRPHSFDLVWSNGVIHHTPDAHGAFNKLADMVAPGGLLYVWVYAKRFNPFRFTKDVLDFLRVTRLPEEALLRVSTIFARLSLMLLNGWRAIRRVPMFRPRTRWGERSVRPRTVDELRLTWFDALSPQYDSRHTESEVISWFKNRGFTEIGAIEEPKVGVRGVASVG